MQRKTARKGKLARIQHRRDMRGESEAYHADGQDQDGEDLHRRGHGALCQPLQEAGCRAGSLLKHLWCGTHIGCMDDLKVVMGHTKWIMFEIVCVDSRLVLTRMV